MSNNIKLGSQVRLKSGGPVMQVSQIKDSDIICCWVNDENIYQYETFKSEMLKIINPECKHRWQEPWGGHEGLEECRFCGAIKDHRSGECDR